MRNDVLIIKKLVPLLIAAALLLTLSACRNKAVRGADELIEAIGEVTLDPECENAIIAASNAVGGLTEKEYKNLKNGQLLLESIERYAQLKKQREDRCNAAIELFNNGEYEKARAEFDAIGDWGQCPEYVKECDYCIAMEYFASGDYEKAKEIFATLGEHRDSTQWVYRCKARIDPQTVLTEFVQRNGTLNENGEYVIFLEPDNDGTGAWLSLKDGVMTLSVRSSFEHDDLVWEYMTQTVIFSQGDFCGEISHKTTSSGEYNHEYTACGSYTAQEFTRETVPEYYDFAGLSATTDMSAMEKSITNEICAGIDALMEYLLQNGEGLQVSEFGFTAYN